LHYEKLADGSVKCIEDEIPFDLADGWVWTRFSSIADISLGKMLDAAKNKGDAQKYLRNVNVRWGAFDLSDVLEMRFEEDEFDRFSIVRGDLVVCEGGEPGRCAIWDSDEAIFYQKALHRVRPISVLSEFIYYVLRAFIGAGIYDRYYTGTTIKHLTGQSIKMLPIPLPPLNEQRRLTEQLDKMQLYIDAIESDKSDVITLIAQTKSQILDLAIRGQLVPQDSADEPASVLLERIRAEKEELVKQGKIKRDKKESIIFRGDDNSYYRRSSDGKEEIVDDLPYAIPDSWEWTTIGELFAINPRNKIADDMDVSFIPMPLIDDGYSGYHRSETKQWKEVKTGFTHFQNGDIGLAKITPCFENRKSVIFRDLCNGFGAGTTELHVLRPQSEALLPEYALALLKSEMFINSGVQAFTGAVGQQRVGKDYVMNTYFPLPPYAEQHRIVDQISKLFALIATIETAL